MTDAPSYAPPGDIAGYLFQGEPYCPKSIAELFLPSDDPDWVDGPLPPAEVVLDYAAGRLGIDRTSSSLSSYTFPTPIYRHEVSADHCFTCGKPL